MNELEIDLGGDRCSFTAWSPDQGRVFPDLFALEILAADADGRCPRFVQPPILITACDGRAGRFVSRRDLPAFLELHRRVPLALHDAPIPLRAMQLAAGGRVDLYAAVERGEVWDTRILARLLALAAEGHTARVSSGLEECCRRHLGLDLPPDADRASLGRLLGSPLAVIPAAHLESVAKRALATRLLFDELHGRIRDVLRGSRGVWGYVDDAWLGDAVRRFGPLTHHVQLRSAILMEALRTNGILLDRRRGPARLAELRGELARRRESLRKRGFLPDGRGSGKVLQSILREFARAHPDLELRRTPSGDEYSTAEEDLVALAAYDPFFADLAAHRAASRLVALLERAGSGRVHGDFGSLLETGRTYCGGLNLQGLPREAGRPGAARTIRGCFVPAQGNVFIDADYRQAELVALAHALLAQFGLRPTLAGLLNSGQDIHRAIAAAVLGKPEREVTRAERDGVKPIVFGRPGGMGAAGLRAAARAGYGIDLSDEDVSSRIASYEELCPELNAFLADESDPGLVIAIELSLTPAAHAAATGIPLATGYRDPDVPRAWLGGMLLRALGESSPATRGPSPRPYSPAELDFFWARAHGLAAWLGPELRASLFARRPDPRLRAAILDRAGRRPVFTITGRLRAEATFCGSRNTIFQGLAADGAILGLWRVWRAGYRIVNHVHDEVMVEVADDAGVPARVAEVVGLMQAGMAEVVPGVAVGVDARVTRSLNKDDLHRAYSPAARPGPWTGPTFDAGVGTVSRR